MNLTYVDFAQSMESVETCFESERGNTVVEIVKIISFLIYTLSRDLVNTL